MWTSMIFSSQLMQWYALTRSILVKTVGCGCLSWKRSCKCCLILLAIQCSQQRVSYALAHPESCLTHVVGACIITLLLKELTDVQAHASTLDFYAESNHSRLFKGMKVRLPFFLMLCAALLGMYCVCVLLVHAVSTGQYVYRTYYAHHCWVQAVS